MKRQTENASNKKFSLESAKITAHKKIWFLIPVCIFVLAGIFALIFGLTGMGAMNLGIDFTGGTVIEVRIGGEDMTDENYAEYRSMAEDILKQEKLTYSAFQKVGDPNDDTFGFSFRLANMIDGKQAEFEAVNAARENVINGIREQLTQRFSGNADWNEERITSAVTYEAVDATASTAIWFNALFCVLIAAALILVYIAVRFHFNAGIAAIISLLHDVLIMVSFVVIAHWQINAPFIAAMITIIGYSINNTIVVFDRIRENNKKMKNAEKLPTPYEMADISVKQTLTRSINTSVTTLLTIVMLFILGVTAIREFTLPLIVGLLAGTFSSIFIAPSLWSIFETAKLNRKRKRELSYQQQAKVAGAERENA